MSEYQVSGDEFINRQIKSHIVGFREAFDLFDREGDGNISSKDFLRSWRSFGFEADVNEVRQMLEDADEDGSGELQFVEFVFMVAGAQVPLFAQCRRA